MKYTVLFFCIALFWGCKMKQSSSSQRHDCEHGVVEVERRTVGGVESEVSGVVFDFETKEPLPFARVYFYQDEKLIAGMESDVDGKFRFKKLALGKYTIKVEVLEYHTLEYDIKLEEGANVVMNFFLTDIKIFVEKPVIYVYPKSTMHVDVALDYKGKLVHTYPHYSQDGWHVTASREGKLWDEKGQEYYALFWEGMSFSSLKAPDGFVVSGKETAAFLEEKLAYLGLSRREANEFIMYWLPRMESNPYNFIHFAGEDYNQLAPLRITPEPTTLIRVMMLTKPLQEKINMPLQDLTPLKKERLGFTVVEWGGQVF